MRLTRKTNNRKGVSKAIAIQEFETQKTTPHAQSAGEQVQDIIRLKAYELYMQRGCQNGSDLQDWLAAEHLVLQARSN